MARSTPTARRTQKPFKPPSHLPAGSSQTFKTPKMTTGLADDDDDENHQQADIGDGKFKYFGELDLSTRKSLPRKAKRTSPTLPTPETFDKRRKVSDSELEDAGFGSRNESGRGLNRSPAAEDSEYEDLDGHLNNEDDDFSDDEYDEIPDDEYIQNIEEEELQLIEEIANRIGLVKASPHQDSHRTVDEQPIHSSTRSHNTSEDVLPTTPADHNSRPLEDDEGSPGPANQSRATGCREWDPADWKDIDTGEQRAPRPVNPDDVARFRKRAEHAVKATYADAQRRFKYQKSHHWSDKTMTFGFACIVNRLGIDRILRLFLEYTPDYVQSALGKPEFDERAWKAIPGPSLEDCKKPFVYGSMTKRRGSGKVGRYHGSGTAKRCKKTAGGGGKRVNGYNKFKGNTRKGKITKEMKSQAGRHLNEALRPDVDWSIRVQTIFPMGTPRAFALICEGIWIHMERTLSASLPPPESKAALFQHQGAVDMSRRAVLDYQDPPYLQLNGATSMAQGTNYCGDAVRDILFEEVDGICRCCEQPLPTAYTKGDFSTAWATSKIPGSEAVPIHYYCQNGWSGLVDSGKADKSDEAAAKEYCDRRRELMGATDRIPREKLDHLQKRHEVERQGYKCACGCGLVLKGWQDSTWIGSNMPGVTGFILHNCYNSFRKYKKRNPNNPVNEASVSLWKKSQDWQLPAADKRKVLEAMDWTCQCGCDVRRESVDRNTWTHNRMPGIGGAFIASACQRNWKEWCKKKGGREVTLENVQL